MPPEAAFERSPEVEEWLLDEEFEAELPWYEPASSSTDDAETVALKQVTLVFSGVGATRTMSAHLGEDDSSGTNLARVWGRARTWKKVVLPRSPPLYSSWKVISWPTERPKSDMSGPINDRDAHVNN